VGPLLVVVTFAAIPFASEPLFGPFATMEAACGSASQIKNPAPASAFCDRNGAWHAALRRPDGWFIVRLPVQDGVTPARIEGTPPAYRIRFHQHAFSSDGVDVDGDWVLPCVNDRCASEAIPVDVRDRSRDVEVDVAADVLVRPDRAGRTEVTVVFTKLRVLGQSPRVAEWRALVERLRGQHTLP
jgi:hypothetical protein